MGCTWEKNAVKAGYWENGEEKKTTSRKKKLQQQENKKDQKYKVHWENLPGGKSTHDEFEVNLCEYKQPVLSK